MVTAVPRFTLIYIFLLNLNAQHKNKASLLGFSDMTKRTHTENCTEANLPPSNSNDKVTVPDAKEFGN